VILNKTYAPSARWDETANRWDTTKQTTYQWLCNKNKPSSPKYNDITDALQWIIDHDESKETD
jgi:hypothetical protein